MSVLPARVNENHACAVPAEARKECQLFLELESQRVVNCHVGAGN